MNIKLKHVVLLIAGIALTATACMKNVSSSNNAQAQFNTDTKLIQDYLTGHGITAQQDSVYSIFYRIDSMGTGISPKIGDTIQVTYTGRLLNDSIFQKTDSVVTFLLNQNIIPAWQICVPKIKSGGGITIYSQSYYGYGNAAQPGIPANSVLIFDVQLHNVKPGIH